MVVRWGCPVAGVGVRFAAGLLAPPRVLSTSGAIPVPLCLVLGSVAAVPLLVFFAPAACILGQGVRVGFAQDFA